MQPGGDARGDARRLRRELAKARLHDEGHVSRLLPGQVGRERRGEAATLLPCYPATCPGRWDESIVGRPRMAASAIVPGPAFVMRQVAASIYSEIAEVKPRTCTAPTRRPRAAVTRGGRTAVTRGGLDAHSTRMGAATRGGHVAAATRVDRTWRRSLASAAGVGQAPRRARRTTRVRMHACQRCEGATRTSTCTPDHSLLLASSCCRTRAFLPHSATTCTNRPPGSRGGQWRAAEADRVAATRRSHVVATKAATPGGFEAVTHACVSSGRSRPSRRAVASTTLYSEPTPSPPPTTRTVLRPGTRPRASIAFAFAGLPSPPRRSLGVQKAARTGSPSCRMRFCSTPLLSATRRTCGGYKRRLHGGYMAVTWDPSPPLGARRRRGRSRRRRP